MDLIEATLLCLLPWSFATKTIALGFIWIQLRFHAAPVGPLGIRINISFRDQALMSAVLTWAMFILSRDIDASEIDWPFVTLALAGLALWPLRTAWSHVNVYRQYRDMQREPLPPTV